MSDIQGSSNAKVSGEKFVTAWIDLKQFPGGMMTSSGGGFNGNYGPVPAMTSCLITTSADEMRRWVENGKPVLEIQLADSDEIARLERRVNELNAECDRWADLSNARDDAKLRASNEPPAARSDEIAECEDILRNMVNFAHENGYHENGYDVVTRLMTLMKPVTPPRVICKSCSQEYSLSERHKCPGLQPALPPSSEDAKDAARYRFLRQPGNAIVYARDPNAWGHNTPGHIRYNNPEQLDAAIDAACSGSTKPDEQA